MTTYRQWFFWGAMVLTLAACGEKGFAPVLNSVDPTFGPKGTLVTMEGEHLAGIESITFSGEPINFNAAFNADHALLLRIPTNVPLGEHEVVLTTALGSVSTQYRVTERAPLVSEIFPESGGPGQEVVIRGVHFFEPIEIYFFDSIQAQVVAVAEDSIRVIVPEGAQKGRVRVNANGGTVLSPNPFFTVNTILVNDFDGNGMRPDINRWIFRGNIKEDAQTTIRNDIPAPISQNFMKLSGDDAWQLSWIGGAESYGTQQGGTFTNFGMVAGPGDALLEMDLNSNGRTNTHIILILLEKDGSPNDFSHNIHVDWDGWQHISVPLNRFKDLEGFIVDPSKVHVVKVHLIDNDQSGTVLEVNVDNIQFVELL